MVGPVSIVWFRADLRLADQPALDAAARRGGPVVPVFVWSPEEEGRWPPGAAARWWLHHSLSSLAASLEALGSRLVVRQGPAGETLRRLVEETGAQSVFWNRRYEPAAIERDTATKALLQSAGVDAESFGGGLLHEPWTVANRQGQPFQVFTPFYKTCLGDGHAADDLLPAPARLRSPAEWPDSVPVDRLGLLPQIDWAAGFRDHWQPGEIGAGRRLARFAEHTLLGYKAGRDQPAGDGVSELSPHLHFGELSPRQVRDAARRQAAAFAGPDKAEAAEPFVRQLYWREFAHHLLYHFPHTPDEPLRPQFARFPWRRDPRLLRAWQRGQTGYPLVDAGMRQLWRIGWMHNRVRMVVASFLVKDLLLSWREGAAWFWDTLVDADLANNTLGWQWTAGCGADAAPYFRIFNPVSQGEKFDPAGDYVRRWVPELAALPAAWIHRPWEAPAEVLRAACVTLGENYPRPIVDHATARAAALAALAATRRDTVEAG